MNPRLNPLTPAGRALPRQASMSSPKKAAQSFGMALETAKHTLPSASSGASLQRYGAASQPLSRQASASGFTPYPAPSEDSGSFWDHLPGLAKSPGTDVSPQKAAGASTPVVSQTSLSPLSSASETPAAKPLQAIRSALDLVLQKVSVPAERYRDTVLNQKNQQARGDYDVSAIRNPYHHTQTNNYFKDSLQESFQETYHDWSGQAKSGQGFAYIDKYGFSHVTDNYFDSLIWSKDGQIYQYSGSYKGGYATDALGNRMSLSGVPGAVLYGNFNQPQASYGPGGEVSYSGLSLEQQLARGEGDKEDTSRLPLYQF